MTSKHNAATLSTPILGQTSFGRWTSDFRQISGSFVRDSRTASGTEQQLLSVAWLY